MKEDRRVKEESNDACEDGGSAFLMENGRPQEAVRDRSMACD